MKPSPNPAQKTPRRSALLPLALPLAAIAILGATALWLNRSPSKPPLAEPRAIGNNEIPTPAQAVSSATKIYPKPETVDGEPSTPPSPTPPSVQPKSEIPSFRLSAMSGSGGANDAVGIVDRKTGAGYRRLKIGDSADGWRLVSIDFDRETALFQKSDQTFTARMETGESILPPQIQAAQPPTSAPRPDSRPPPAGSPSVESPPRVGDSLASASPAESKRPAPSAPFSNVSFRVDSGESVSVRGVSSAPDFVEIQTGNERYALRRGIAESIMTIDNLTPDDRLWMMVSYPGLVQILPGEDPARQASEAERLLAEELVPPTNRPDVEELNRLLENFVASPPPSP